MWLHWICTDLWSEYIHISLLRHSRLKFLSIGWNTECSVSLNIRVDSQPLCLIPIRSLGSRVLPHPSHWSPRAPLELQLGQIPSTYLSAKNILSFSQKSCSVFFLLIFCFSIFVFEQKKHFWTMFLALIFYWLVAKKWLSDDIILIISSLCVYE